MHPVRRRKKRPNNGIRTIEVCRGNNGFGFTISGQQPCILSSIVRDSPAERAGLRAGDYLVAVNGQNVSKASHDDVVRLIGCSTGLLKLQIAENYYSDSSDEDHALTNARSKPKHAYKQRNGSTGKSGGGRVAKVVRDLRTGAMFDKYGVEIPVGQCAWDVPALPPPRVHPGPKEELCFFLGYLGTIEMPKLIQPGSRCQVVRCCVKRLRAEKRSHTWVVMRVHADGVTLTGAGGSLLADYPVHRICYCGPSGDEDRKYVGLVTAAAMEDNDTEPSSSCHIFAIQSSVSDHDKHVSKAITFRINCTSGPLSDGCFEFPSTSESVLNAVRSFCLTKDDQNPAIDNELLMANSPQPSHAGSTAASSNSDSGIGFRDDCGHQSDRIVMVDIENQRLHIQQLCDDGKTLDIQLAGARRQDGPSANLQQAFACVSALCPLPAGELDAAALGQRLVVRAVARSRSPLHSSDECRAGDSSKSSQNGLWADQSVFHRLGLTNDCAENSSSRACVKSSENLESFNTADSLIGKKSYKSYDDLFLCSDELKLSPQVLSAPRSAGSTGRVHSSPLSVSYGAGEMLLRDALPCLSYSMSPRFNYMNNGSGSIYFQSTDHVNSSYKLSPKVFGVPRPLVSQSLEELASPPPPRPSPPLWGSLQHLPLKCEAIESKDEKELKDGQEDGGSDCVVWASSFEKLVDHPLGLETFTEFLKKEFSQENMTFWLACVSYSQTTDLAERRKLARSIFDAHLAEGAPEAVNVDAQARQLALSLESAPKDLFSAAQKQIFNLMKFDSYPRFLKSQLYQQMVGKSRKLKKSCSDAEDCRRKSLLPWARKNRSKSRDSGDTAPDAENRPSEDAASISSRSSLASWDLALRSSFTRQSNKWKENGNSGEGLVRVLLADGATAVVQLREGETVKNLVERVLAKRGLSYNAFEVYMAGEDKALAMDDNTMHLASHEIRVEQRVLFRLDLPNRKTVSVKAKATKTLAQALRPVLHKYNYPLEMVTICSMSENEVLEPGISITAVDGRRLTVLTRSSEVWRGEPPPPKTFVRPGASLDEITNKVFEELLQNKGSAPSSAVGSVRSERSGASSATLPLPLPLPRFLRRDSHKPGAGSDSDDLYEGLKRAQRSRLEDQRGTEINFELPDFLKDKENSSMGVNKMRKMRSATLDGPAPSVETRVSRPDVPPDPKPLQTHLVSGGELLTIKPYETPPSPPRKPPPLPPKPKLLPPPPYRNHNFTKPSHVKNYSKLNRSRRAAYLDEATSSIV